MDVTEIHRQKLKRRTDKGGWLTFTNQTQRWLTFSRFHRGSGEGLKVLGVRDIEALEELVSNDIFDIFSQISQDFNCLGV